MKEKRKMIINLREKMSIMMMMVLILLWFGAETISAQTTTSTCQTVLQAFCTGDPATCCTGLSSEIQQDLLCVCTLFANDMDTLVQSVTACKLNVDIRTVCGSTTLLPPTIGSPPQTPGFSFPSPTSTSTPSETPADSTPDVSSPHRQTPRTSTSSETSAKNNSSTIGIAVGVSVAVVVLAVIIVVAVICGRRLCGGKSKTDTKMDTIVPIPIYHQNNVPTYPHHIVTQQYSSPSVTASPPLVNVPSADNTAILTAESLQYDIATLTTATNNFSDDNKLGEGGFGIVYKGILPDGRELAIKRLSHGSGQGDKEFKTEILLLAELKHKNLVKLLGFCKTDDEELLVYEYLPNKSLDYFIFDNRKRAELNWPLRFEIVKGIAKGILYLHEDSPTQIVHRDLKAANVLLDAKMHPKIADFGIAKICEPGQTQIRATRRIVGTEGYMSPEYRQSGRISVKSDVYAFGVIILEIISGRRVSGHGRFFQTGGGEDLISYAWRCWEEEKPLELVDSTMRDSCSEDEVRKCMQIGLLCVQEDITQRPTMSTIVSMLNSYTGAALVMPQPPPHTNYSTGNSTGTSSYGSTILSTNSNTTSSVSRSQNS